MKPTIEVADGVKRNGLRSTTVYKGRNGLHCDHTNQVLSITMCYHSLSVEGDFVGAAFLQSEHHSDVSDVQRDDIQLAGLAGVRVPRYLSTHLLV